MESQALAVQEEAKPMSLYASTEPSSVVERATSVAKSLVPIIDQQKLFVDIQGRKFVKAEGWVAMLAMLNVFPRVIDCKRLEREGETTYEARVELTNMATGVVVGAAEAMASSSERKPWSRDEFSVKSMAQTRAVGKAARLSFSWIMALAGYEPTPSEEMPESSPIQRPKPLNVTPPPTEQAEPAIEWGEPAPVQAPPEDPKSSERKPGCISTKQQKLLFARWRSAGYEADGLKAHIKAKFGKEHSADLTFKELDEILKGLEAKQ